MPTIIEIRQLEINKANIISAKLRAKLLNTSIHIKDEAVTDIRDIYEVCSIYLNLIDKLVLDETSENEIADIFHNINNDLYIHLPYHCKNLKKPLQKLLDKQKINEPKPA